MRLCISASEVALSSRRRRREEEEIKQNPEALHFRCRKAVSGNGFGSQSDMWNIMDCTASGIVHHSLVLRTSFVVWSLSTNPPPLFDTQKKNLIILMSILEEKPSSSSSWLASEATSVIPAGEIDPLLKDLNEKKQSFRRNVVSLAAELKEVRTRLTSQEQSYTLETLTRQVAEAKAKNMEEEIGRLEKKLEERNAKLQASASTAEKCFKELDDLRSQLSATQAIADSSAASAQSARLQCLALVKELEEKNGSLKEHEHRVTTLGEQLDKLQRDMQARESSQKQLKDDVLKIENDIMQTVAKAGASKDCELRKLLNEVSPKNFEKINKLLIVKDEEIAKLKDEIKIMSAHWENKTKELESQLEKQRRADQELKKRVLKLEFCLQEARSQTRKLQRMGERRDKALKELRDQLAAKQQSATMSAEEQNFWETSGFKIVVSMSMLILVVFSKR
ncbi:hypothetical protein I3842_08G152100 [Carya illinoinensis]|uniref:Uncharacterized protein n=1 Tax=Carya illinoinensis TaxID=32201 RepID=A0A922JAM8_CARIL|nr:hypothetical protein I3842_08G152100 [Carya illinoinensis]